MEKRKCKGCDRLIEPKKKSNGKVQTFHSRACYILHERKQRAKLIVLGLKSY